MTREETLAIMSVLKAAYPNFYRDMKKADAEGVVSLWSAMFADEPAEIVATAVKAHIATDEKGFPPHIGAIKNAIVKLKTPEQNTEQDAWNLVKRAVRNGIYGSAEEFDKLPSAVQRLVGSHNQLKEWALMDAETLDSVVASNFMRSYKVVAQREKERLALPQDVQRVMAQIAGGMSMAAIEEKARN